MRWMVMLTIACATTGSPPPPRGEPRCWAPSATGQRAVLRVTLTGDCPPHSNQVVIYEDATWLADADVAGVSGRRMGSATQETLAALRARWSRVSVSGERRAAMDVPTVTVCWLENGQRAQVTSTGDEVVHYGESVMRTLGLDAWMRSVLAERLTTDAGPR